MLPPALPAETTWPMRPPGRASPGASRPPACRRPARSDATASVGSSRNRSSSVRRCGSIRRARAPGPRPRRARGRSPRRRRGPRDRSPPVDLALREPGRGEPGARARRVLVELDADDPGALGEGGAGAARRSRPPSIATRKSQTRSISPRRCDARTIAIPNSVPVRRTSPSMSSRPAGSSPFVGSSSSSSCGSWTRAWASITRWRIPVE